MARMKKKGQAGAAKNYVTRNQAIRKLQLTLQDFRKLCIWKGIYPREPRSRKKVNKSSTESTTFYYAKDIQYLLHEPILQKFRDQKALEKKISKALGRGDFGDAKRLESNAARPDKTGKPHYTLDHVIRERYPTFVDAIRDLDDCLSMLFLFANLPSSSAVPAKMIARCERLCLEFQHYLIVSQSLKKSFLSIKGIYYQANIQGEDVLWLVPYKFKQNLAGDIDFRIMGTFVEFYMTLLGFVNFRLYTASGLKYPPKFDATKDDDAAELGAFTLEGKGIEGKDSKQADDGAAAEHQPNPKTQATVNKIVKELAAGPAEEEEKTKVQTEAAEQPTDGLDKFEPAVDGGDVLPQPEESTGDPGALFSNFTFFLGRETPRQPLEFILKAFGCRRVGWDAVLGGGAFTTNELDPRITHQIVDRPVVQPSAAEGEDADDNQTAQRVGGNRVAGRVYVQPQWVWDCANDEELKRPDLYAPGAALPPHLSPFARTVPGRYDPTKPLQEQLPEGHELAMDSDEESAGSGMEVDDGEDDGEEDAFGGFSGDEEEKPKEKAGEEEEDDEDGNAARRREIEAELSGKPLPKKEAAKPAQKARADAKKEAARKAREEEEELERAKGMLSKKKRKLFEKMQHGNQQRSEEDMRLMAKRRKLERGRGKPKK